MISFRKAAAKARSRMTMRALVSKFFALLLQTHSLLRRVLQMRTRPAQLDRKIPSR